MCSVSISIDGEVVKFKELNDGYSHAENLNLFIQEICEKANLTLAELDAVAISKGPGSYTGLRIGVSTVKGICFALDLPLISISTLEAMASDAIEMKLCNDNDFLCPMLDARRMEVYAAIYDQNLNVIKEISADIIDDESYQNVLEKNKVVFFGPGAAKCESTLSANSNALFTENIFPSSRSMAKLSDEKFKQGDFEDVAYFEPFYLKDFVATVSKK